MEITNVNISLPHQGKDMIYCSQWPKVAGTSTPVRKKSMEATEFSALALLDLPSPPIRIFDQFYVFRFHLCNIDPSLSLSLSPTLGQYRFYSVIASSMQSDNAAPMAAIPILSACLQIGSTRCWKYFCKHVHIYFIQLFKTIVSIMITVWCFQSSVNVVRTFLFCIKRKVNYEPSSVMFHADENGMLNETVII